MTPRQQALDLIRAEHRTLTAVIDALKHVAGDVAQGKLTPDYKLMWSIVYYIEEVPEQLHHRKEDLLLFPRIRSRSHDYDDTLDDLIRQHSAIREQLQTLKTLLGRMEAEIPGAAARFGSEVTAYAAVLQQHMKQEETEVLTRVGGLLTEQDWQEIATAFAENHDPMHDQAASASEWFRQFYRRIVTLVPEPWGVGQRR